MEKRFARLFGFDDCSLVDDIISAIFNNIKLHPRLLHGEINDDSHEYEASKYEASEYMYEQYGVRKEKETENNNYEDDVVIIDTALLPAEAFVIDYNDSFTSACEHICDSEFFNSEDPPFENEDKFVEFLNKVLNVDTIIIRNISGINRDNRSGHIRNETFEYILTRPRIEDFIIGIYRVKNAINDPWYEMYGNMIVMKYVNNNVVIEVTFDHGS